MPPDTDVARKQIEDEIEQHLKAVVVLKRRLNTTVAISRLPNELLAEIFVWLAQDYYDYSKKLLGPYSNSYGTYSTSYGTNLRWIRTSHVCHTWREVALTTPRLWSFIQVARQEAIEMLLVRSKQAPLLVCMGQSPYRKKSIEVLGELLPPETCRLREVYLDGSARDIYNLCTNFTQPANLLHVLNLSGSQSHYSVNSSPPPLPRHLFGGQFPRLRNLELHQIAFSWDNPVFCKTLTNLVVIGGSYSGSFEQLLYVLEQMTELENLGLEDVVPSTGNHTTSLPPPSHPIMLPRLRDIWLCGFAIDTANLLRHLSPAIDTELVIATKHGHGGLSDLVAALESHLDQTRPVRTAYLAQIYRTQLNVSAWPEDIGFHKSINYLSDYRAPFRLELEVDNSFIACQRLIGDSLLFSTVRCLEVETGRNQSWAWEHIISGMPNLRILGVLSGVEDSFLDALCVAHPAANGDVPSLVLPHLEVLSFSNTRLGLNAKHMEGKDFKDRLVDCLILRCNYNLPVQEVHLTYCRNTTVDDVDRLREVVPEVVWDGDEEFEEV